MKYVVYTEHEVDEFDNLYDALDWAEEQDMGEGYEGPSGFQRPYITDAGGNLLWQGGDRESGKWPEELNNLQIAHLRENGIVSARILRKRRDSHGYPDYLLEGKGIGGDTLRGWLREGESIYDIRWEHENVDGWPQSVALDGEPASQYS